MSDHQTTHLLPCPFCGGEAALGAIERHAFVNCVECLASTNILTEPGCSKEQAAETWNKRAPKMRDHQTTLGAALRAIGEPPIDAIRDAALWLDDRADAEVLYGQVMERLGGDPIRDERAASAAVNRAAALTATPLTSGSDARRADVSADTLWRGRCPADDKQS